MALLIYCFKKHEAGEGERSHIMGGVGPSPTRELGQTVVR